MIGLSAAEFLVQWSAGSILFLAFVRRHGVIGPGFGWLVRGCFAPLALLGIVARDEATPGWSVVIMGGLALGILGALLISIVRVRRGQDEGPVWMDVIGPVFGLLFLLSVSAWSEQTQGVLETSRLVVGGLLLGCVTVAMLLGHWYLVQPGMTRAPLREISWTLVLLTAFQTALLLIPIGMVSVFTGAIDDGYNGLLGWFWAACVVTSFGLAVVTLAALREPRYAAVMAATGLLYLAIVTVFGLDLVGRALLA